MVRFSFPGTNVALSTKGLALSDHLTFLIGWHELLPAIYEMGTRITRIQFVRQYPAKVQVGMCVHRILNQSCAPAQSDQDLSFSQEETLVP